MNTMSLPVASPLGSIEAYVSAVNAIPMLTHERELDLGKRLKDENDLEAARDLVLSHLRLVVAVSRNYLGYGLPHADLIQEGSVGLMKAVKRFDYNRGVRLASFAIHWIKAEIHEYILRNWKLVKVATTKAQRKLFFNLRSMKPNFGSLTVGEIREVAKTLSVKESDVIEMEKRMQGQEISFEPVSDDDERAVSPIAWLADASERESDTSSAPRPRGSRPSASSARSPRSTIAAAASSRRGG